MAAATPRIVYGSKNGKVTIDAIKAAKLMRELGTSKKGITNCIIYVDFRNRFVNNGTHYPAWIGRLRFSNNPELKDVKGDVVRLTTIKRGKARSARLMNATLAHELVHVAQADRNDKRVIFGWLFNIGFAVLGAYEGAWYGKPTWLFAILGAIFGYELGYSLAPHERQARQQGYQALQNSPDPSNDIITLLT